MKRLFLSFLFATLAIGAASVFAQDEAEQNDFQILNPEFLAERFNTTDNAVLCVSILAEVCNDIVVAGSYNGWDVSDVNALIRMQKLEGVDGCYVAEIPFSENLEVKIVQLDNDGSFNWDYQAGNMHEDWVYADGNAIGLKYDMDGCNLYLQHPGAYIYYVLKWYHDNTPCKSSQDRFAGWMICVTILLVLLILLAGFKWFNDPKKYLSLLCVSGGMALAIVFVVGGFQYVHLTNADELIMLGLAVLAYMLGALIPYVLRFSRLAAMAKEGNREAKLLRLELLVMMLAAIVLCLGVMFKLMHWPGATGMIFCSSLIIAIVALAAGCLGGKMLMK